MKIPNIKMNTNNEVDMPIKALIGLLQTYYKSMVIDDNASGASCHMCSIGMKEIYSAYLEKSENNELLSEDEIELLKWILKLCNLIYNHSGEDTGLSDSEYDILYEYYKSVSKDESIITESENSNNTVNHRFKTLRGTLDKIYKITEEDVLKNKSQKSLNDWVKQMERRYFERTGDLIDLMEYDIIAMPKFDGVSCVFECDENGNLERALTRGDTKTNEAKDITHIFKNIFTPIVQDPKFPHGIKTEIMMTDSNLEKINDIYCSNYKNTRSVVSSILNSDELDGREEFLHIVPLRYSYIDKNGTESKQYLPPAVYDYPYLKCKLKEVEKIHEYAFNQKTVYPGLRCDGIVIRILDEHVQEVLGRENEKQKFEVAFKFTEETAYSEVKDIIFTTGLFGRINPVVVIKPIKMKGNMIEKASLGSYGRFKSLDLSKGDVVKVMYDIIPYVDFIENDPKCIRSGKSKIKVSLTCPECGSILEESETGELLYCNNSFCPCREKGVILNYCKKMNISNISYATIDDLYNEHILRSIEDLYKLENQINIISQLNGYGITKISNIIEEINNHKTVIPSVLLGSIGIEGISTKTFKKILEYMTMSEIIEIAQSKNYDFFTVIPGIKEKTAKKLVDGINNNMKLISFLIQELNVENEPRNNGSFSVVFTKVRNEEIEKFIEEYGGVVSDSLTKDTSLLVIPEKGVKSSKITKAEKYGIPIIPINDVIKYIKNNY